MKPYLCQYGNCQKDTPRVVVSVLDMSGQVEQRNRFCCHSHAALYLADRARRTYAEPEAELVTWAKRLADEYAVPEVKDTMRKIHEGMAKASAEATAETLEKRARRRGRQER